MAPLKYLWHPGYEYHNMKELEALADKVVTIHGLLKDTVAGKTFTTVLIRSFLHYSTKISNGRQYAGVTYTARRARMS